MEFFFYLLTANAEESPYSWARTRSVARLFMMVTLLDVSPVASFTTPGRLLLALRCVCVQSQVGGREWLVGVTTGQSSVPGSKAVISAAQPTYVLAWV